MWELAHKEGWALKIWCFQIVVLEKTQLLWTASRPDQSILKEINPIYSLEGLMLKLKLQNFGHLMGRANSLKKTLMLGKIEGKRKRRWKRVRWLDSITDSMNMSLSKLWHIVEDGGPGILQLMESQKVRYDLVTEQQHNALHLSKHLRNISYKW